MARAFLQFLWHEVIENTAIPPPPGWDASPLQGYPTAVYRQYPFIHLGRERQSAHKPEPELNREWTCILCMTKMPLNVRIYDMDHRGNTSHFREVNCKKTLFKSRVNLFVINKIPTEHLISHFIFSKNINKCCYKFLCFFIFPVKYQLSL